MDKASRNFLPDFCAIRMLFAVVVVAQLAVFLLMLARWSFGQEGWNHLGLVSLYVRWIALSSLGVLCALRSRLSRYEPLVAAGLSYIVMLSVKLVISDISFRLLQMMGGETGAGKADFLLRTFLMAAIIGALLLRYFYVRHQWEEQVKAEARARIESLAARIRPHFLFNSLNTIAALTATRPALAEELVQDLAELFLMSMQDVQARIRLDEELDIARRYLHIEQQRLSGRLKVEWQTKNLPLDSPVPPLILQPLLENAVYHGIEPNPQGGTIEILATYNLGRLRLEVRNPLSPQSDQSRHQGNQMALNNIRERLQLAFGAGSRLEQETRDGQYRVRLLLNPAPES